MSEEKGARSVARGSLSVAASPLNGVKFELGVILFVGLLLVPVAGRLFADPLWQVLALAVYGCAGALWLVLRARRVLGREADRKGAGDGTQPQ